MKEGRVECALNVLEEQEQTVRRVGRLDFEADDDWIEVEDEEYALDLDLIFGIFKCI